MDNEELLAEIAREGLRHARDLYGISDDATAEAVSDSIGQLNNPPGYRHTTGRIYKVTVNDGNRKEVVYILDEYYPGGIRAGRLHYFPFQ